MTIPLPCIGGLDPISEVDVEMEADESVPD